MYSNICSSFLSVCFWYSNCRNSTVLIRSKSRALLEIKRRISTKAFIMLILIWIAVSLLRTADNIAIPCSIKTYGKYLRPPLFVSFFEVTNCDLKDSNSSLLSWNLKLSGKRAIFLFTAWLNTLVSTWYSIAKSLSIITCRLRTTYIKLFISDWADSMLTSWVWSFVFFIAVCSVSAIFYHPFHFESYDSTIKYQRFDSTLSVSRIQNRGLSLCLIC